jgi:hypothetical protein
MSDHQVGTIRKYSSERRDYVRIYKEVVRTYHIYRKSETEYEYLRTGNASLWKGYEVEVVVGCPFKQNAPDRADSDLTIFAKKPNGQTYSYSAYRL